MQEALIGNEEDAWAKDMWISMMGLIGAGKSTLAEKLSNNLNLPLYKEEVAENPCLQLFYSNPKEYGFLLQVDLLAQRYREQIKLAANSVGGVQDRSIYEDLIFCRMLLKNKIISQVEYNTYLKLWNTISTSLPKPNIIVHLKVSPEICHQRIRARGRKMEEGISLEYLQDLHTEYEKFLEEISRHVFVVTLEWSEFHSEEKVIESIKDIWENAVKSHHITLKD